MKYTITIYPNQEEIFASDGELLLDVLARNGHFVSAACGGKGTCGKCKVRLLQGAVNGDIPDENGEILSCKSRINGNIIINLKTENGNGLDVFQTIQAHGDRIGYGVALDIGTTTLCACLVDLKSGEVIKKISALNPQGVYGADVLSRIKACQEGKLSLLQGLILDKTNDLIKALAQEKAIEELTVSANTTILHLFLGISPETIGAYPFTPVFTDTQIKDGISLGLPVKTVRLLPSASAYIGSDITAGVLACKILNSKNTQLFVDVGTNGEVVLSHAGKLYATSTAAGPALEGACIECGMGGVKGAIDKVLKVNGDLQFTTIESAPAQGICGSGLIDLISVLLSEGLIDETGAWNEEAISPLTNRLKDEKFYLSEKVYLSQRDIRQFQLAKSAICAGIESLLLECGVKAEEVQTAFIAGGLGYYMNVKNAVDIGLIPQSLENKISMVGNTSLSGARLCLINGACQTEIEKIARKTEIIELSFSKIFQELYITRMSF